MASALFTPGRIGALTLPNRLIRSATQDPFGQRDGTCAPEQVALYRDIAQSGVGAIITAYSYISPEARSTGIQVGFATEAQRQSQKEVLDAVHAAGGRLILQLMHAGMNVFLSEKRVEGGKLLAPSGGMTAPNEMLTTELDAAGLAKIKADFVDAAKAAKAMGFDGVQLHCAHGYLLSQFLDPNANHRTDEYGGSAENRFRFPGECLRAIREAVGAEYPVLVKVNTTCSGEADAAYAQDILYFCRQFQALGADALELSGHNWLGLGKKKVPTFYLERAKAVRAAVTLPLILVGGIRKMEEIDAILEAGIDFVSASRPFICQPDFYQHLEKGEASPCIGCTKCLGNIWSKEGRRCVKHEIPEGFPKE
ncbi:MAG: NADH:flavin oxidoreductase [Ruminiclostridium sp.]|jgi:2,4-dienoyl-CoA reductase-like NADH-dependent reductase (Old Yellow Enzyme family)|nr:NADH:flavin oxidoreductase [Ruminiclostridium sp.]